MLLCLTVVVIIQDALIPKHHVVYLKYIQFLFVKHTSIKLEINKNNFTKVNHCNFVDINIYIYMYIYFSIWCLFLIITKGELQAIIKNNNKNTFIGAKGF